MSPVFDVELWRKDQPGSDIYAALRLPATPYELLDAMDKLRLEDGVSPRWEITTYHSAGNQIADTQGTIYELNALAQTLSELDGSQITAYEGLLRMEARKNNQNNQLIPISRLIDLSHSTGCCHVVDEVLDDFQLGQFCAKSGFVPGVEELPDAVFHLLDFEQIGREHRQSEGGVLIEPSADCPGGYVELRSELVEAYKDLDLTPKQPDYMILLEVSKGFFNDPGYDSDKTVPLKLPAGPETLSSTLEALDIWDWREAGWRCLDCRVPSLIEMISDEEDISSIQRVAQKLADMEPKELNTYKALLTVSDFPDLSSAEQLMDTLDQYIFSPQFSSPTEVARGELSVILAEPEIEMIVPHLNLYQYGQALIQKCGGILTDYGLIERKDRQPVQTIEDQPRQGGMEMR